ncbi:MAG: DUF4339 domain-containing protein [Fibromonadales bacterium]|nr:DUF4339 domain-containing protein [Fibromonadales bacterium]
MEQKIWHTEINGQQQGPFSIDELLQNGLTDQSLVWKTGMANWLAAKEVPEMVAALNLIKMRNEIEIDIFKYVADENDEIRVQIERLEKSYEELLDEKSGIKAMLKTIADRDAELSSRLDLLKKSNEKLPNLKLGLTVELKAIGNENIELRSKLKKIFAKLIQGVSQE